jgi:hypothetical protein
MRRLVEQSYPFVLGLAVWALAMTAFTPALPTGSKSDILTSVITIGSIATGFLGTALAVLFTMDTRKVIRDLKKSGVWRLLLQYFIVAINLSFILCLLTGVLMYLDLDPKDSRWAFATWLAVLASSLAAYYRVVALFFRLMSRE